MKIFREIKALREELKNKRQGSTIGFVPTMGYLHEGHLALLKKARKENDILVLSIFVNPLQFGPNEDFDSYPRDMERDEKVAGEAGADYIFYPSVEEMYPASPTISVTVAKRTSILCGASRPGHFDGVAVVLTKLFNIVQPDRAYFGMKDAQQVAVIDGLVQDFNIPVDIVPVETVREHDGLAKSSRNVYLSESERMEAPAIYRSLLNAKEMALGGETKPDAIADMVSGKISRETSGILDYIEVLSYPDLERIDSLKERIIIAAAVKFSRARLIDNIIFTI
ncbi:pantoate--beta-alanine ligase [Peribacillus sp. SCS-26]|uniref:pantoate--beta-alanine ligase n=1 Tax=Paraperibacillus marinus TaxID=3115295 RepID=UPI00390582D4